MNPLVPLPVRGRDTRIVAGFGIAIVAGYALQLITKWEPISPQRDELPASVRSSPGGYRSYHFWHSGFHGGK